MEIQMLIAAKQAFVPHLDEALPVKLAYKVMRFIEAIENDEKFYRKKINEIAKKYAEINQSEQIVCKDDKVSIRKGTEADCQKEINELNTLEVDKPAFEFTLDELECVNMTPKEVYALKPFIKQEE